MKKGDNIKELGKTIRGMAKRQIKVQTAYVTVKSVDWDNKTMEAVGVMDELPYYDVRLGLGNVYRKPKPDCTCLIGMIENQDAAFVLIEAEELDETVTVIGENCQVTAKKNEMQIKVGDTIHKLSNSLHQIKTKNESLKDLLDDLLQEILNITVTTSAGPSGTPINAPQLTQIKTRITKLLE